MNEHTEILYTLFRKEFAKLVAIITKSFGLKHIETAEDIVSDTFLYAIADWKEKGLPANPTAWLYTVTKQKALQLFRREKVFTEKIIPHLKSANTSEEMDGLSFSDQNIRDSQLQMIFAVCHPAIASEAQMALALRVLCGFGIEEIAEAFLTSKETINKRLFRAKERLREVNIPLEMPSEQELSRRLDNVLHILYLLFNAGYYSSLQNQLLRKDLCFEALHLGRLLTECSTTNTPETNALMALMCFHSSRFEARYNETVSYNLYEQQDESLWDQQLIEQGSYYLELAANGKEITSYHLEAGIAFWNTYKEDTEEKWENILQHYNLLMQINYSPVVALNRTYALYKARGKEAALQEAEKLQLTTSHFYYALLGELFSGVNDDLARQQYEKALSICKTESERQLILQKMKVL